GNAATAMIAGFGAEVTSAAGSSTAEPTFDAVHVARSVAHLVEMPLDVSVPSMTIMARAMPYFGRG
ncbi:MAG: 3-oxoacyl-ACP reductase, partial [Phenylobacterium sp.]